MKKFLCIFSALFVTMTAVVAAEPEDFIPEDSSMIFRVDCRRVLDRLEIALKNSDSAFAKKFRYISETLKTKHNIALQECFSGQAWGSVCAVNPDHAALYIKTQLPEKSFASVFDAAIKNGYGPSWQVVKQQGRNIYVVSGRNSSEKFAVTYAAGDVIKFSRYNPKQQLNKDIAPKSTSVLTGHINKDTIFAACLDITKLPERKKFSDVYLCNIAIDLLGTPGNESITAHVDVKGDAETIENLSAVYQFILPALLGAVFSNDPTLAIEQTSALKFEHHNGNLCIDYKINCNSLRTIVKYFMDPANRNVILKTFRGLQALKK